MTISQIAVSNYAICRLSKHAADFTDPEIVKDEFVEHGASLKHVFAQEFHKVSAVVVCLMCPY